MYLFYKFFTFILYPFTPLYLLYRKIRKKEDPIRYKEKLSKINIARGEGFLIWFHVASVGEAMSILPLIDACIKEDKIKKILITTITLSSGKILTKKFNNNTKVIHQFLPLDVSLFTEKFLKHWDPNLCVFIDSEIWPNLILNVSKNNTPLLLLNARITRKSFVRWRLVPKFAKKIFEKFDLCVASNKESENFLKILGAKNIKNHGNLKFSNIKKDLDKKLENSFLDKVNNRKIWCAAITHSPEEIMCAKSHLLIKNKYKNVLTVIIPRHIDRIEKINKDLSKLNLSVNLFSEFDKININTDILLVDTYGILPQFYSISKCVFLGKSVVRSLVNDSGQNPIEPARQGCKIFHGRNVSNFVEIYEYLKNLGITKEVNNSEQLGLSIVEEFKKDKAKNHEVREKIQIYGENILNNVIVELKKYI